MGAPASGAGAERPADSPLLLQPRRGPRLIGSPGWLRSGPVLPAWAGWSVILGTIGAAIALLAGVAPAVPSLDPATLLLLVAFMAVAEVLGLELLGEGGGSSYSISAVPMLT